jgi:hypothetical protein
MISTIAVAIDCTKRSRDPRRTSRSRGPGRVMPPTISPRSDCEK